MNATEAGNRGSDVSGRASTRQLDGKITTMREQLGGLVAELDRRRHALFNVRLQVRRHTLATALTGVALVSAASGFVWLQTWRSRRRQCRVAQVGRLREAVSRMIDRPERVAIESGVPAKILTAAANAVVAALIKKMLERWLVGSRAPSAFRFKPAMPGGAYSKASQHGR